MSKNLLKIIGLGASVLGIVASLVSNWVGVKTLDITVAEKVAEALVNKEN